MKVAISIPRLPDGPGLRAFVQRAEALGFDAVLAAQTAECLHGNPEGVARVLVAPVQAATRST